MIAMANTICVKTERHEGVRVECGSAVQAGHTAVCRRVGSVAPRKIENSKNFQYSENTNEERTWAASCRAARESAMGAVNVD